MATTKKAPAPHPSPSTARGAKQAAAARSAQNAVQIGAASKRLAKKKTGEVASLAYGIDQAARNSLSRGSGGKKR